MKRNIIALLSATLLVAMTSCGKFGDINVDPNKPVQDDTRYLFIRGLQGSTAAVTFGALAPGTSMYNPWGQIFPQYLGEGNNLQYTKLNITNATARDMYTIFIRNMRRIQTMNTDPKLKSSSFVVKFGPNNNQIGAAKTMEAFYVMLIADTFGSMPYEEMLQGDQKNFTPKFNTVEEVYTGLDKELSAAFEMMSSKKSLNGTYDIVYNGDMSKWKKFNASIRMALAIKLSDIDPATGKARFAKAYADGGLEMNADNFTYPFLTENANANPLYKNYYVDNRKDFFPTSTLVDAFLALKDPRVLTYAAPNPNGDLVGAPWGFTKKELNSFKQDNPLSFLAANLLRIDTPWTILSASRVKLMEAEAAVRGWISADANKLYQEGIRLSFESKDIEAAKSVLSKEQLDHIQGKYNLIMDVDTYLAQPGVTLGGTEAEKIEKIAYQRWLNGFLENGMEAWSDWRRLNVPKLSVGKLALEAGATQIPYRMVLSTDDWDQNRDNYKAMISQQGENTVATRLWWDIADNK